MRNCAFKSCAILFYNFTPKLQILVQQYTHPISRNKCTIPAALFVKFINDQLYKTFTNTTAGTTVFDFFVNDDY